MTLQTASDLVFDPLLLLGMLWLVIGSEQPSKAPVVGCFHTTKWTEVLAAGSENSVEAGKALARLCQTYWLPVYTFIRKRGHNPDQAQDQAQDFFASFLEKNTVARAVRERGRFRSFLMTSVENFLHNAHEREHAQKRGGGKPLLSLEELNAEGRYLAETTAALDPAGEFELQWALTVLQRVMQRLREEHRESGRTNLFDSLQAHLWGDFDSVPYPKIAQQFELTVAGVKTTAHRLRQRYRVLLREEIAQTVAQPGEIDEEIRYLMRVVRR